MKTSSMCVGVALMLIGCCPPAAVKIQTVTVDKPIPFIPPPPKVPEYKSYIDDLLANPNADAGTVAQAYRLDVYQLRQLYRIQQEILGQYSNSSSDFSSIVDKINKLQSSIGTVDKPQ